MNDRTLVTLANARSYCIISPALGGSILSWEVDGQNILRETDNEALKRNDPLLLASFPLVPYSNRIGNAQFDWARKRHELKANFRPEPHAIHGVGWKQPWRVVTSDQRACTMELQHAADEYWPWPFEAVQKVAISDGSLQISLSAKNLADHAVPLGFGHHPYFDQDGASLCFQAKSVLMNGPDMLPTEECQPEGQFDFSEIAPIKGLNIDHCYSDVNGHARIEWKDRRLALEINSDLDAAVVYIPEGGDAFCFEPVPHVNNALNWPDLSPQMPVIAPGGMFEASITMQTVAIKA